MRKIVIIILLLSGWLSFGQQNWSLEDCLNHANEQNPEILLQKFRNQIAEKEVKRTKSSYLPDLNFNASQGFNLGNSFNVSTNVGQLESRFNSFSLSSSTNLFEGFSNRYKSQIANIEKEKGETDLNKIRLDLSLNIANKYLEILFNKELLQVAEKQREISNQEVLRLTELFEAAIKPKSELLAMQSTNALDNKNFIVAQNNVNIGLIELKEMIDIKDVQNFDIQNIDVGSVGNEIIFLNPSTIYDEALSSNPSLRSAQHSLDISEKNIQVAKSRFYPKINFNYSYGSNYYHLQGKEDLIFNQVTQQFEANGFFKQLNSNKTHYLGFSLTAPIFNRFATKIDVDKSKIEAEMSEVELVNEKNKLKNTIEIAHKNVLTAEATLNASKTALLAQKEAFDIAQRKYRRGFITSYEFLEEKSNYTKTEAELISAKYDYLFKVKLLEFYK